MKSARIVLDLVAEIGYTEDWNLVFENSETKSMSLVSCGDAYVIVESWIISDVGKQRAVNEDCAFVDSKVGLYLVLDGMGGHRAGEVASGLAMETIASFYKKYSTETNDHSGLFENYDPSYTYHTNLLRQATYIANEAVLEKSSASEEFLGMGSTVVGMVVQGGIVSMINVGDTRMYLIRNGRIEQISRDHTLAEEQVERGLMSREEARESQLRHILSSVIGVDTRIRIHMDELVVFPGDIFLLCTDGLTAVMDDPEILDILTKHEPSDETLQRIVDEVNSRGGPDNVTIALTVFTEECRVTEDRADPPMSA